MHIKSSYKDPSGHVYIKDDEVLRTVAYSYKDNYDFLLNSGLYAKLVNDNLLISHEEKNVPPQNGFNVYKTIRPVKIKFISHPFEWCFSQLKDAALITLKIQLLALEYGMSLKDASAFNIQFHEGKPVLIDTLSFEIIKPGMPWVAYKQFCQHFLAPLALMSYKDVRLIQLFKTYLDGIPLDLANSLLPLRKKFNFGIYVHLVLHSKAQKKYSSFGGGNLINKRSVNLNSLKGLIVSLEKTIKSLTLSKEKTAWSDYYDGGLTHNDYSENKKLLVREFINSAKPKILWDLGANDGLYSRIASRENIEVISFDFDHASVEKNYRAGKEENSKNILPLILDLTNPSPPLGWDLSEGQSIFDRGNADTVLALALVHHLSISKNIPLSYIAEFLSKICERLIIEFVPKSDPKVKFMLSCREDIFPGYTVENFQNEFLKRFTIERKEDIKGSLRTLFLMKKI